MFVVGLHRLLFSSNPCQKISLKPIALHFGVQNCRAIQKKYRFSSFQNGACLLKIVTNLFLIQQLTRYALQATSTVSIDQKLLLMKMKSNLDRSIVADEKIGKIKDQAQLVSSGKDTSAQMLKDAWDESDPLGSLNTGQYNFFKHSQVFTFSSECACTEKLRENDRGSPAPKYHYDSN